MSTAENVMLKRKCFIFEVSETLDVSNVFHRECLRHVIKLDLFYSISFFKRIVYSIIFLRLYYIFNVFTM